MSERIVTCPICGWDAKTREQPTRDAVDIECETCGRLTLTGSLFSILPGLLAQENLGFALSAFTRQATERSEEVVLDTKNWRELALAHASTTVPQQRRMLLELLGKRTAIPGALVRLSYQQDAPLVDARNEGAVRFLLESLQESGWVKIQRDSTTPGFVGCLLTSKGFDQLEAQPDTGISRRCFVAMSCDPALDSVYTLGILPAVKDDCGCDPFLIEKTLHNDKICDRVLAEIRRAHFVIADVTLHRQNVYFEAGFAVGLRRPVIWTCREDEFTRDKQHFDTRQYPHIIWKDAGDLRQQLADRIRVTILRAGQA